jgi:acyl-CoA dehydrogenase
VVPLELLKSAERTKQIFNIVLGSIAAISLLVGGIGIMNIMLASVTGFVAKSAAYANERSVFGKPIGENQGIQFPIARAHVQTEAAALMVGKAAALFDAGEKCGAEANMAKMLAADASKEAADVCIQTLGGYGFAEEYDIERKFRETRLYQVAPVSTNLILSYVGTHVLGMPKSF